MTVRRHSLICRATSDAFRVDVAGFTLNDTASPRVILENKEDELNTHFHCCDYAGQKCMLEKCTTTPPKKQRRLKGEQ